MIRASIDYYSRESSSWLLSDGCPEYLRKVEARLNAEHRRVQDYLHPSSHHQLFQCLYDTLLIIPQSQICDKEGTGVKAMLETHATADLTRVYQLYSNVPNSLTSIGQIIAAYCILPNGD